MTNGYKQIFLDMWKFIEKKVKKNLGNSKLIKDIKPFCLINDIAFGSLLQNINYITQGQTVTVDQGSTLKDVSKLKI